MSPETLFHQAELMQLESEANKHEQALSGIRVKTIITMGLVALLGLVLACEYQFLFEIFSYLKGGMPGEESQWSVGLLSGMGCLAVIAFHLRIHGSHSRLAVMLGRFVDGAIPVYVLGIGLMFAAILWADGADSLAGSGGELFSDAAPQAKLPLDYFTQATSYFGAVFVIGCGSISIVNLFIAHGLLERIRENINDILKRKSAARLAQSAITIIRDCQRDYAALYQEQQLLLHENEEEAENALAHEIMSVIGKELLPFERYINEHKFRAPNAGSRLRIPEELPFDLDEMQKRVSAIKSINVKSILAAMRS